jgi:HD-GYP domain-containing protein (c-di-GMP phosphodiesterase class II)
VPTSTLVKPGALSPVELDEIREHPWLGERIVAPVPALGETARQVIASHHERWDGSGYPRGLRGTEIPLAARVFAVADSFDAMTHDQPYRGAMTVEAARDEIRAKAGFDFDPDVAEAFLSLELPAQPNVL